MNHLVISVVLSVNVLAAEVSAKNAADAELIQTRQCFDRTSAQGGGAKPALNLKDTQSCCQLMSQVCQCLRLVSLTKKNKNVSRETEEPPLPILNNDGTQATLAGYPLTESNLKAGLLGIAIGAVSGGYFGIKYVMYVVPAVYSLPLAILLFSVGTVIIGGWLGMAIADIVAKIKKNTVGPISGI